MSLIFADTFTGSGTLDGHAPGTTLGSEVWVNGTDGLSLSGGFAVATVPTIGGPVSYSLLGDGVGPYTASVSSIHLTFSIRTGADVSFTADRYGASVGIYVNGNSFSAAIVCDATANWRVGLNGNSYANVTLAADTTYTGTLTINDGSQTLSLAGQTVTDTLVFTDTSGVNGLTAFIGDQFKIGPLSVITPSTAVLTLPKLTISAAGTVPPLPKHYFRESFLTNGLVNGTAPTVVLTPTDTWFCDTGGMTASGGFGTTGTFSTATLDFTEDAGPRSGVFSFSMKTGTLPTGGTVGEFWNVRLTNGLTGPSFADIYLSVGNHSASIYTVSFGAFGSATTDVDITLASNTEYAGVIKFTPTTQEATFLGQTLSKTGTFPEATTGITSLSYSLVSPAKMGPMALDFSYLGVVADIPLFSLSSSVSVASSATGQGGALISPALTLFSFGGGRLDRPLPVPTLHFIAHDSYGENALIFTAPALTLSGHCGGNANLSAGAPTLSSTGSGAALALVELTAPAGTLSATGTVSEVAHVAVTAPMARLVGYGGAVCHITTSAGTLTASGTSGGVARAEVTVPLAQLTASGTAQNYGSALLVAPAGHMVATLQAYLVAPTATLTAIGTATITATYEAYALNLNHPPAARGEQTVDETTRYTNFPFTHVIRHQNSYYGVAAGALYLLEGTTDDGTDIPYAVETAKTDFGQTATKTLVSAYIGGRIGPAETVTLIAGDAAPVSYAYTTPRGPYAQNYRQKFGRGIKDRYYALGVSGTAEFSLDSLDIEINQLTRRI